MMRSIFKKAGFIEVPKSSSEESNMQRLDIVSPYEEFFKEGWTVVHPLTLGECWAVLRKTEHSEIREINIEDHTWEKAEPDFDPVNNPFDIGDWVIASYTRNTQRDYFGRFIMEQFPLTLAEVQMVIRLIEKLKDVKNEDLKDEGFL